MISFKLYSSECSRELMREVELSSVCPDREIITEAFGMLEDMDDSGIECAVACFAGCLLIRIFTDEYSFVYPIALSDNSDELSAVNEIRLYSIKEEIPLVICDVPEECADALAEVFANAEITLDEELDTLTLRALSEIMLTEGLPDVADGDISLSPLERLTDSESYERLSTDEKNNEFWGYNYLEDGLTPEELIGVAERERERGVALSLAVRERGELIGEAVLYAFDLLGGCECALRLLPEKQGKGIGKTALGLLLGLAEAIGLRRIYAVVSLQNAPSLRLFEKFAIDKEEREKTVKYSLRLN